MDLFPFWPGCKLILHLLVLRILVALQWHPLRLLLSFLWRRWTLLCEYCTRAWIIFYSVTSEYNSAFVICEILVPTPNSWDDRCPLMTRSERFCLLSLLHRSPLFLFLTFVSCHAGIYSSFSHSLPTAAFASGICIALGIGINLCTRL